MLEMLTENFHSRSKLKMFSHFYAFVCDAFGFVLNVDSDYIYVGFKFTNNIERFGEHNDISGTVRLGIDARVLGKQCRRSARNTVSHSHNSSK